MNIPTPTESIESSLEAVKEVEPSPDLSDDTFKPQSQGLADSSCLKTTDAPIPSTLPSQEPFFTTVSENNEGRGSTISGDSVSEIDTVMGENITSSGNVSAEPSSFTFFNPCSQTLDQEVDMDVSTNAKLEIGHDVPHQGSVMEDVSEAEPKLMPVPEMNVQPCSSEHSPVHSDSEKSMDGGPAMESEPVSSGRDQREVDNTPSLAQALKELHKLLMSNSCPNKSPLSDLNTPTPRQDADGVAQVSAVNPNPTDVSHTATTNDKEESVAKADLTSQSMDDTKDLPASSNPRHLESQTASLQVDPRDEPSIQCPDGNQDHEDSGLETSFKEEGQQGPNIADGNTSGFDTADLPQQLLPLSVASGSSTDSSLEPVASPHPQTQGPEMDPSLEDPIHPSSQPTIGQFPLEHMQRIQASGFSANEAAEALEQAQGNVELALLMLLARTITVPT